MIFEISEKECELLHFLLKRELDELGSEIHHTHSRDYREDLKVERRLISDLLDRLQAPQPH